MKNTLRYITLVEWIGVHKMSNIFKSEDDSKVEKLSALHGALYDGNNRAIDILLSYMAKIPLNCFITTYKPPLNCSENFSDILYQINQMVDSQSFLDYT